MQEPFARLFTQGMIRATATRCPSRRATSCRPQAVVERYGADTARCYILFLGPPGQDADWSEDGRRRRAPLPVAPVDGGARRRRTARPSPTASRPTLLRKAHWAIDKVTRDMQGRFAFNTAIAAVMELVNEIYRERESTAPARTCASRSPPPAR